MSDKTQLVCSHCSAVNSIPSARLGDKPKCGKCKQALFTGKPIELTDSNFAKVVNKSGVPVVVDFWAEWCGPCKMMGPAFSDASSQLEPNVILAKLNTETAQQTAGRFNIRSIPSLVMFKDGKEVARQAGAMSAQQIVQWVNSVK